MLPSRAVGVRLLLITIVAFLWATVCLGAEPDAAAPLLDRSKILEIHIEMTTKEYDAMQPPPTAFGFGAPGAAPAPPPAPPDDGRARETNQFGTSFAWAEAKFTAQGKSLDKVGIRYDGDFTYFLSAQSLKRPLKIEFNRFEDKDFEGVTSLRLHSMALDASKAREVIAFAQMREMGVMAPQATLAEVTLTVPGKFEKAYLGLYTVVEGIDSKFLAKHLGKDQGLLMKPRLMRGIDYLGDDWNQYTLQYASGRGASKDESKRIIEFAKLVQQSSEEEFNKRIGEFLDVEAFLRFTAANALLCNLESFHALGSNYHLYLDSKTGRFTFLPGDLEFSMANFLLFGTPDQLMDLSVTKPYPGENKLVDRLMAVPEIKAKYLAMVKDLAAKSFTKEQLNKEIDSLASLSQESRDKETKAVAARREPPAFGAPPGTPQAPDLKTFVDRRLASIDSQLKGESKGFVPQPFSFGSPGGGQAAESKPIDEATFREVFEAPPGFETTLFAAPPQVNSPVAISAAPSGEIYVAVDQQGSLGRTPGGGRIVRCLDEDRDGKVDKVTTFAKVEHPRGVVYRAGKVYVMHPPTLSVFYDDDGDGVADGNKVLVTGLTTNQIDDRGGDHTTNGVRLGIDGWLYIGVGDYGIKQAKGTDGKTISLRGGGIVRVRPDGMELEVYCMGLRNPFDIAIDPMMNLFTRDNTNDGAGWDTRVSHLMQTAQYGYTQLFANFTDETMPTLGTFGGGGGTGGVFIQDYRWPKRYRDRLYTGDWGRSEVYRHDITAHDPTFDLTQEVFLKAPRATGMDIDADGHLYVASWRGGDASVDVGPNVGFVARVSPAGLQPDERFPDLQKMSDKDLLSLLVTLRHSVGRFHVQGEILRRAPDFTELESLVGVASNVKELLEARVVALYTVKQLIGTKSHGLLLRCAKDPALRQQALRALTDRKSELAGLDAEPFIAALSDRSPQVRGQAAISLGRMDATSAAKAILPLTSRPQDSSMPTKRPIQNQPDADRVVPHLAARALIALDAVEPSLEALDGEHWRGALWVLRSSHTPKTVDGLIKKLGTTRSTEVRRGILVALIRLQQKEADYAGSWWGIRPDNTGPYYERVEWPMSKRIASVLTAAYLDADPETAAFLKAELRRHQVSLPGIPEEQVALAVEESSPIVLPMADPKNPEQIGNMSRDVVARRVLEIKGDAQRGKPLFKTQSCVACHTDADGQSPKGPHLVDIGKRSKPNELVESILQPSAKLAQGYEGYTFHMNSGLSHSGFVVRESASDVRIRELNGIERKLAKSEIEERVRQEKSVMPDGVAANLTPGQLADLIAYLQSLKSEGSE